MTRPQHTLLNDFSRCRDLVFLLRSGGVGNNVAIVFINEIKAKGVQIEARPYDVTDVTTLKHVLDNCACHIPLIKGCVQN